MRGAGGLVALPAATALAACLAASCAGPGGRSRGGGDAGRPPAGAADRAREDMPSASAPDVSAADAAPGPEAEPAEAPDRPAGPPAPPPPEGWARSKGVGEFDRAEFTSPDTAERVRAQGTLRPDGGAATGWVEFDVDVPGTGWYEVLVEPDCGMAEYLIDGTLSLYGHLDRKGGGAPGGKLDSVWLAKGRHTVRAVRYIWWGVLPDVKRLHVRAAGREPGRRLRVEYDHGPGEAVLRRGEALGISVFSGGAQKDAELVALLKRAGTEEVVSSARATLPASDARRRTRVELPCPEVGAFSVSFALDGRPVPPRDLRGSRARVVDTSPVAAGGGEIRKTLLTEIDCAAREPDWVSGGATRVVRKPWGAYRESGDVGFLFAQHHNTESSWFAYRFRVPEANRPYVLEVDCPDDDYRTYLIVVRDSVPGAYPVAGGVDTGGCWPNSGGMLTHSILFWPKGTDLRALVLNPHNGRRAAAARVRVYAVEGGIEPLKAARGGGRVFVNWYEEGSNFVGFYGGRKGGLGEVLPAADTWPRATGHMGVNMVMPTVAVYQMSLYPSRYNVDFADPATPDVVRLQLLLCEKYGTRYVAEFHPESRELDRLGTGPDGVKANALVSKDGKRSSWRENNPKHHPLHPVTREWYAGMIDEFVARYGDSRALGGVSLRLMSWANPSLNNFGSLDWGYGDFTVSMFERETGTRVPVPAGAPDRFAKRHEWLLVNARERWIEWRCAKIAELHADIASRVRKARGNLTVYLHVFDLGREAGIDPGKLAAIDGLVLVSSAHEYGRRRLTYEGPFADQRSRDALLSPEALHALEGGRGRAAFIFGAGYFEGTEVVAPPERMGYPAETKRTWTSGVVNPAGRHALERYAVTLAETDALMLGDGGNAYTLGQPVLREFMREFRSLPAERFAPRDDARDPVAVWELARPDGLVFYAVNRERFPAKLGARIRGARGIRRLATGEAVPLRGGRLEIGLRPYELVAFRAPAGAAILAAKATAPPQELARLRGQVDFLRGLDSAARAGRVRLGEEGARRLRDALAEATRCLAEGRVWRARTLMEHHRLATEVYEKAGEYPPGIEFPDARSDTQKVRPRAPPEPDVHLSFDAVEDGRVRVGGRLALAARCEGGCSLEPGVRGKAVSLDGRSGRVVVEGAGLGRLSTERLTVSAWVKPLAGGRRGVVDRQKWPDGFGLLLWNGSLMFEANSRKRQTACRTPDSIVSEGEWHHVAATVEMGGTIALFLDGERVKETDLAHAIGPSSEPLLVGYNGWGGRQNDPSPGLFRGAVDEVKVWNRVLAPAEVVGDMKMK